MTPKTYYGFHVLCLLLLVVGVGMMWESVSDDQFFAGVIFFQAGLGVVVFLSLHWWPAKTRYDFEKKQRLSGSRWDP